MNTGIGTPEGTRDRLLAECLDRRATEAKLTGLFRRRGYGEVMTPAMEYYDLFVLSGNPLPQESMLKSIDRSGKILVMRPDSTAPIARLAATRLGSMPLPKRLFYSQAVFRSDVANGGGRNEIAQCGVELIGAKGRKADVEMIALAVDALRICGLKNFHVEIGHAGFFRALAKQLGADGETLERMRKKIEEKNFAGLGDLLEPYRNSAAGKALYKLSYLFGGAEVLDEARSLGAGAGELETVEYLSGVWEELKAAGYDEHIRFDLGLVHRLEYYTGLVFRGYAEGAGDAVLSGGRYDTLTACFGRPAPATGFAVDVDAVTNCLPPAVSPPLSLLIHYGDGQLGRAIRRLEEMEPGTCELSSCETPEETVALAKELGCRAVLVLENETERTVRL
jgi:ATP phosphoribosyltransferase regulatory subunit